MSNPWRVTVSGRETKISLLHEQTYVLCGLDDGKDHDEEIIEHEMLSLREALTKAKKAT